MKQLFLYLFLSYITLFAIEINIGSGGSKGVYYPVAKKICKILSKSDIKCKANLSVGSKYNIYQIVRGGKFNLGIAQNDIIYKLYGKRRMYKNLRTIMTLYTEQLTLIVKKNSGIESVYDILDKKINTGVKGSGTYITASILIKEVLGRNSGKLKQQVNISNRKNELALKQNRIDGYFFVVGHPNQQFKDFSKDINLKIIELNPSKDKKLQKMINRYPYYNRSVIRKGTYKNIPKEIITYGVKATVVVSADMDEKLVSKITTKLIENLEELKKANPSLKTISKKYLTQGLGAPLHKGAKLVYKQKGLL